MEINTKKYQFSIHYLQCKLKITDYFTGRELNFSSKLYKITRNLICDGKKFVIFFNWVIRRRRLKIKWEKCLKDF
jgi:hypothetical protein